MLIWFPRGMISQYLILFLLWSFSIPAHATDFLNVTYLTCGLSPKLWTHLKSATMRKEM